MKINSFAFKKAIPVWEKGEIFTKNRSIVLTAKLDGGSYAVNIAGATAYEVILNGELIAHGPARAGHGYYRVDVLPLDLKAKENAVEIRAVGYNINSFEYLDQPSFICAEILDGETAVAYTACPCVGFTVVRANERIVKTHKYSFQRVMTESYKLAPGAFEYQNCPQVEVEPTEPKNFIAREIPYGEYARLLPASLFERGAVTYSDKGGYYNAREICNIDGRTLVGYKPEELEYLSHAEVGKIDFGDAVKQVEIPECFALPADSFADIDMGIEHTGLFEFEVQAEGEGTLFVLFDEVMNGGRMECFRLGTSAIVSLICKPGKYRFISAEPYVMRYVRVVAQGCAFKVKGFKLIEIAFPMKNITAEFKSDDAVMKEIYDAAVETFRANTVDIYMDCPSRERAGWLCDSFFTSRVEKVLTGKSLVERAFLQNFLLPEKFKFIPEGMLPMCYPSDHNDGVFIPNWAMWYGVELGEYFGRTGDRDLVDGAKERMYGLYKYFTQFENEFGLIEKLQSWVFVEWSKSNELVQDVSFASNMLYAKFLDSLGEIYGDAEMLEKAKNIRNTVNRMAMTESGFYCDNAVRVDGKLVLSGERTESCQYYAFFCDFATPESNPWLWNTLVNDFGYDRKQTGKFPEIYFANAFIGNYLRLDLLCRYGCYDILFDNIKGYFKYMADKTGTLWENDGDYASCNHGFASHVLYWMKELGLIG